MKIKVACFAAILLLAAGPAEAEEPDGAVDDAGTAVADAQLDAEPDVVSADDGSATSDTGVADAEIDAPQAPANDGGTVSDAGSDGSAGNVDGGTHDGGGVTSDAGPPPPIHQFYNENPGCSLGGAPDPAVGGLVESALVALLFVRRRRAGRARVRREE
jgi:MYXO-CTERM domain-containing protein